MRRSRTWRCAAASTAVGTNSRNSWRASSRPARTTRTKSRDSTLAEPPSCRCSLRCSLKRPPDQRPDQKRDAFHFADLRTRAEHVAILLLDFIEDLESAAAEQFEIDRETAVHLPGKRQA